MAFAVIDFETTGLMPERSDRVVEIGIVHVDDKGQIEHEWTTLVNPRRDVGATHVHGLRAADLLDAPEFGDVADQILGLVTDRTVVAHNASFDMRFLQAELARAGYVVPSRPPALCSMKWSGRLIGPAKLQHACEALGIELVDAHSAMGDARATAGILTHLTRLASRERDWSEDADRSRRYGWPGVQGRPHARTAARGERKPDPHSWLDSVLGATWIPGVPEVEASYLLVLDRALLDRSISISEAQQLTDAARDAGLSGASVARIHRSYLHSAAQEALADGVLTDEEKSDIVAIADALRLTSSDVEDALASAAITQSERKKSGGSFALVAGDRIVFTGETSQPRETWVAEIVAAGLTSGGVTKSAKLVVAADPDSLSGKAAKARDYDIPIVDERTFVRLFQEYRAGR